MIVNKEEVIKLLRAKRSGNKGWYLGDCPHCGKEGHLAIIFGVVSSFECKKCGKHGTLYYLLQHIKRLDLLTPYKNVEIDQPLIKKFLSKENDEEEIDYKMPYHSLPIGWKRIYENEYLRGRGWEDIDFVRYPVGITKIDPIYKHDYLVFPLYDQNETKGFIARTTRTNEWVKVQNEWAKKYGQTKYLRYRNSEADISKYIYGINEFTEKTETVIIVEGLFDKTNVDKKLNLFDFEELKCGATFGKKISFEQIKRLKDKGVKRIILLYDPDAIKAIKEYSLKLNDHFEVEIGYIPNEKDPGEMEGEELFEVLGNTENIISYYFGKLEKRKLI